MLGEAKEDVAGLPDQNCKGRTQTKSQTDSGKTMISKAIPDGCPDEIFKP
jgi:hypothetical protein